MFDEWPIGWLSPTGEYFHCEHMDHLATAEKLVGKNIKYPSDWLLEHQWAQLTCTIFFSHRWRIILPYSDRLTEEQKYFLRPYVEKNVDWLDEIGKKRILEEFEEEGI